MPRPTKRNFSQFNEEDSTHYPASMFAGTKKMKLNSGAKQTKLTMKKHFQNLTEFKEAISSLTPSLLRSYLESTLFRKGIRGTMGMEKIVIVVDEQQHLEIGMQAACYYTSTYTEEEILKRQRKRKGNRNGTAETNWLYLYVDLYSEKNSSPEFSKRCVDLRLYPTRSSQHKVKQKSAELISLNKAPSCSGSELMKKLVLPIVTGLKLSCNLYDDSKIPYYFFRDELKANGSIKIKIGKGMMSLRLFRPCTKANIEESGGVPVVKRGKTWYETMGFILEDFINKTLSPGPTERIIVSQQLKSRDSSLDYLLNLSIDDIETVILPTDKKLFQNLLNYWISPAALAEGGISRDVLKDWPKDRSQMKLSHLFRLIAGVERSGILNVPSKHSSAVLYHCVFVNPFPWDGRYIRGNFHWGRPGFNGKLAGQYYALKYTNENTPGRKLWLSMFRHLHEIGQHIIFARNPNQPELTEITNQDNNSANISEKKPV